MSKGKIKEARELVAMAEKRIRYFQQEHDDARMHWGNMSDHMEELRRRKHEAEMYLASVEN